MDMPSCSEERRENVMKLHLVLTHPLSSATLTSGPTTPSDSDEQEPDKQRRGNRAFSVTECDVCTTQHL